MWIAQEVLPRVVAWTRLSVGGQPSEASADVTWRLASNVAGLGYFLTGDASLVLDPASSHGVLQALMSGMMAAHLSVQVCRDELAEESAATAYAIWMRAWFEHDAEKLSGFYGHLAALPEWLAMRRRA